MEIFWFTILFFAVAFLISLVYYGLYAYEIHYKKNDAESTRKTDSLLRKINQCWLNFLGSFTGWIFLYYFLIFRLDLFSKDLSIMNFKAEWFDLLIILIIFIGVTGYLPYSVLLTGIGKLFRSS
jgi:hypothetical protein